MIQCLSLHRYSFYILKKLIAMKKPTTLLTIILSLVLPFMGIHAQVITTTPALPTASDSVILVFNATLGGGGMAGYTGDVYTHTGITIGNNQWQYVIGQWGTTTLSQS